MPDCTLAGRTFAWVCWPPMTVPKAFFCAKNRFWREIESGRDAGEGYRRRSCHEGEEERERKRERERGEGGSKERSFCTHVGTLSWFMLITSASGPIYHQRHGHVAIPETTPLRKIPPMLMAVSHNRRTPFLGASHTQFCRR